MIFYIITTKVLYKKCFCAFVNCKGQFLIETYLGIVLLEQWSTP